MALTYVLLFTFACNAVASDDVSACSFCAPHQSSNCKYCIFDYTAPGISYCPTIEEILKVRQNTPDIQLDLLALTHSNLALCYWNRGDYNRSYEHIDTATEICGKVQDHAYADFGAVLLMRSMMKRSWGSFAESHEDFKKAWSPQSKAGTLSEISSPREEAAAFSRFSSSDMGNGVGIHCNLPTLAHVQMRSALQCQDRSDRCTRTFSLLGDLLAFAGKCREAWEWYVAAREVAEQVSREDEINLQETAQSGYLKLTSTTATAFKGQVLKSFKIVAVIHAKLGQYEAAHRELKEGLTLHDRHFQLDASVRDSAKHEIDDIHNFQFHSCDTDFANEFKRMSEIEIDQAEL